MLARSVDSDWWRFVS